MSNPPSPNAGLSGHRVRHGRRWRAFAAHRRRRDRWLSSERVETPLTNAELSGHRVRHGRRWHAFTAQPTAAALARLAARPPAVPLRLLGSPGFDTLRRQGAFTAQPTGGGAG